VTRTPVRSAIWSSSGREHGDLVVLAVHDDLGTDHSGHVIEACHQMRRGTAGCPCTAQGLAVHCEHCPGLRWPAGRQPGRDPGADGPVQGGRVHRSQHAPDRDQVRDLAVQPQRCPLLRSCVMNPLRDRRVRARAGQGRAHRRRQDRDEVIPHSAPVTRSGTCDNASSNPARTASAGPGDGGKDGQVAGHKAARGR
jgi:hypothetical protein